MPNLPYPRTFSDSEFIKLADLHLLNGELPPAWQMNAIERLRARVWTETPDKAQSQRMLPMFDVGSANNGHD